MGYRMLHGLPDVFHGLLDVFHGWVRVRIKVGLRLRIGLGLGFELGLGFGLTSLSALLVVRVRRCFEIRRNCSTHLTSTAQTPQGHRKNRIVNCARKNKMNK